MFDQLEFMEIVQFVIFQLPGREAGQLLEILTLPSSGRSQAESENFSGTFLRREDIIDLRGVVKPVLEGLRVCRTVDPVERDGGRPAAQTGLPMPDFKIVSANLILPCKIGYFVAEESMGIEDLIGGLPKCTEFFIISNGRHPLGQGSSVLEHQE